MHLSRLLLTENPVHARAADRALAFHGAAGTTFAWHLYFYCIQHFPLFLTLDTIANYWFRHIYPILVVRPSAYLRL